MFKKKEGYNQAMKHNTHIYIAAKAIAFTKQAVDNTISANGSHLTRGKKTKERNTATDRLRILRYYQDAVLEGAWAPDDVLCDNDPYHIFKLFTDDEFPGHGLTDKQKFEKDGVVYYKFAGGLPYRIDHLAQEIISMSKLRDHNDQFDLRQIMYKYLLISHYVVDAHVPMHCDLRDDPPTGRGDTEPSRRHGSDKPQGKYMDKNAHAKLEQLWDAAVTPIAIKEEIIRQAWDKDRTEDTQYSRHVSFSMDDCKKDQEIKVPIIQDSDLMEFMIDVCIESKKRGQRLFPLANPQQRNDDILAQLTREIFADCIGNLLAIWRYIWSRHQE